MLPECCGCGVKFYTKPQVTPWRILNVTPLKGKIVPATYPDKIGLLCGLCVKKGVLVGLLDPECLET